MCLGNAITTINKLLLVSAAKAEELLPKWSDQAEFFSKRSILEANISKNFNIEVQGSNVCTLILSDYTCTMQFDCFYVYYGHVFYYRAIHMER